MWDCLKGNLSASSIWPNHRRHEVATDFLVIVRSILWPCFRENTLWNWTNQRRWVRWAASLSPAQLIWQLSPLSEYRESPVHYAPHARLSFKVWLLWNAVAFQNKTDLTVSGRPVTTSCCLYETAVRFPLKEFIGRICYTLWVYILNISWAQTSDYLQSFMVMTLVKAETILSKHL